jgi:hypothetical protein
LQKEFDELYLSRFLAVLRSQKIAMMDMLSPVCHQQGDFVEGELCCMPERVVVVRADLVMLPDPTFQSIERCKGGRRRGRVIGTKVALSIMGCWRVFHNRLPVNREKILFPAAARESELRGHSFQSDF